MFACHLTRSRRFSVTYDRPWLQLSIKDDGVGFDASDLSAGNGLRHMKRRADELGGALIVDSRVGTGTRVELIARVR